MKDFRQLFLVTLGRFERPAHCLEGSCSIQLSYRAIKMA
jgi:hypothetical protein